MSYQVVDQSSTNQPTAEHLLGQLEAELRDAAPPTVGAGWTPSVILATLFPLLWLLVTQLRDQLAAPASTFNRWALLFLIASLFFDAFVVFPYPRPQRFLPADPRIRFQLTNLFNYRIYVIDLLRFSLLLWALAKIDLGVAGPVTLAASLFYGGQLLAGLLMVALDARPVFVPADKVRTLALRVRLILFGLGFFTGWYYLGPITEGFGAFHATDLLIAGLLASMFYLLRLLFVPVNTPYVVALQDIRYDLSVANIDAPTAKRRLVTVKEGMSLVETLDEYALPFRILLGRMREELREAVAAMTALPEFSRDGSPEALPQEDAPALRRRWLTQQNHYSNFMVWLGRYNRFSASAWLRLWGWLIRHYHRRYAPPLSPESRDEMEALFDNLQREYEECVRLRGEYVETRRRFAAHFAERARAAVEEAPFELREHLADLPAKLEATRAALLSTRKIG